VTQPLFLSPSSKRLRVATLYPWRKDAAQAGGADLGAIVATHHSQAECPEAAMLQATTVARLALGVAHGVTAATRRSTEGIRTDRGIRRRGKRLVSRWSEPGRRKPHATRPFPTRENTTLSQTTLDESPHFILKPFSTMPDASPRPRSPTCTFSPSGSRTWKLSESFCGSNPAAASLARNTSAS
jgi:hypothetical protein